MPLRFTRHVVSNELFESAGVFDVDGDGVLDIVSGDYWYPGPSYTKRHCLGETKRYGEYFDDFSTIALDIDGDGRLDFITGGWWGKTLRWKQNPGQPGKPWVEHIIGEVGNVETTRAWDIDGDGHLEIVPNTPNSGVVEYFKLNRDASGKGTGTFSRNLIHKGNMGHGLGFGDITRNTNSPFTGDIILRHGILERPNKLGEPWKLSEEFELGGASIPILVVDLNGDGLNDLIVGQAHSYGLDWYEQRIESGKRKWIKHPIDPFNAQYHDMMWADIDGDGQCELITGKRYRAHNDNDPGSFDDSGIYYFKWTGEGFVKMPIAFGPVGAGGAGLGIHFQLADLRGTGRLDIIAPGKDGLQIFFNEGNS
jgi:FG-GAP-like repeat